MMKSTAPRNSTGLSMIHLYGVVAALSIMVESTHCMCQSATTTEHFYERLAADLQQNKPMVVSVYVALCDNDSQGIVPVNNRSICNGNDPSKNMYWKGNGIDGYLKSHGWKNVHTQTDTGDPVLITAVYKKRVFAGKPLRQKGAPKVFTSYIVAKAYRGSRIHDAMKDYVTAVHTDSETRVVLLDNTVLEVGGRSHIVGYIGHDYFMDVSEGSAQYNELMHPARFGESTLAKGTFALACVSNEYVRPAVTRSNVYIFALNNFLTYPSAWTVGGIVNGIAQGKNGAGIYKSAAVAFAQGQKCGLRWAKKAFSYGP